MFRIFAPIVALILISCSENSALNDTDVTNPGIISPHITIQKRNSAVYLPDYGKSTSETIEAEINDRNGDHVRIEKGSIKVNGVSLVEKRRFFGNLLFYAIDQSSKMPYSPGKVFDFVITLEDGAEYKASVMAPLSTSFTAPVSVKKGNEFALLLDAVNEGDQVGADLILHYKYMKNNVLRDTTQTASKSFSIGPDKNKSLAIPGSMINLSTLFLVNVTVNVSRPGTIDKRFKSPSISAGRELGTKSMSIN